MSSTAIDKGMSVLFSIISPTYNCRGKIKATLDSVISQSVTNFEYLIIDGFSTDGTKEWISQIQDQRVRILSEPDSGIYEAMNKGVKMARGSYLIFLGAGDRLCPDVLLELSQVIRDKNPGFVYGNVYWFDRTFVYGGEFSTKRLAFQNICHQAIFYHRDIFEFIGHFNLKYKLLADWEMNLRCFGDDRIEIVYVPTVISHYEAGGISGNADPNFQSDKNALILRHLGWRIYLGYCFKDIRDNLRNIGIRCFRKIRVLFHNN